MKSLAILLSLVLASRSWQINDKQVFVQVYYESLCPNSISWIVEQLGEAYTTLGPEWMAVELVPFGKAKAFPTGDSYAFRCPHGSAECVGNKLQACALARLTEDNRKQVNFAVCVMGQPDPSNPSDDCATKAGLDPVDLKTCAEGEEGDLLEAGYDSLTPKAALYAADQLPLILFQRERKMDSDVKLIRELFLAAVCNEIDDMTTPSYPDVCNYY